MKVAQTGKQKRRGTRGSLNLWGSSDCKLSSKIIVNEPVLPESLFLLSHGKTFKDDVGRRADRKGLLECLIQEGT